MWLRSSSRTESRMPSREAAQLKASGLGSHVAVKRAGMEGREAYWSAAARDCGKARGKITVVRETKGHACLLPECQRGAPWRKAPERTRWMPMDSLCECGAVCACSDRTDARWARRATERARSAALRKRRERALRFHERTVKSSQDTSRQDDVSPLDETPPSYPPTPFHHCWPPER